jgi:hypothetical protein
VHFGFDQMYAAFLRAMLSASQQHTGASLAIRWPGGNHSIQTKVCMGVGG